MRAQLHHGFLSDRGGSDEFHKHQIQSSDGLASTCLSFPQSRSIPVSFSDLPRNMALLPPIVIKEAVKVAKLTEAVWRGNPSKESGGNAYVKRKEIEDGARFRPGRRIRVHSRNRCLDFAWPTRRRGQVNLMSVAPMLRNLRIVHAKRQSGKS